MKTADQIHHLISVAAEMLRPMLLPSSVFCYDRVRGQLSPRGLSLRYTLITLLGLIEAERNGYDIKFNTGDIYRAVFAKSSSNELTPGDYGLYLWVDAELGAENCTALLQMFKGSLSVKKERYGACTAMEIAWIIIGTTRVAQATGSAFSMAVLGEALNYFYGNCISASGLFRHYGGNKLRGRFPNFASQIYNILALSFVAEFTADRIALRTARAAADRLLSLQLPNGGWPWLYDSATGRVVERYEIYSVHQDAMAPMSLFKLSQVSDDSKYALAALKGFNWLYGDNELNYNMIDEKEGLIYRSIRRRKPFDRLMLLGNTAMASVGAPGDLAAGHFLEVNPTCRSYHLGWILYAWCGREV